MKEDDTQWTPIERTTPITNPYEYIGIPPPPPKPPRKVSKLVWVAFATAILIFFSAILFYWSYTYHVNSTKPTPVVIVETPTMLPTQAPSAQPTVRPYDAHSLVRAMLAHNLVVNSPQYEVSMGNFYSANVFPGVYDDVLTIPFVDSVAWTDQHFDIEYGLWVYISKDTATTVYQRLVADGLNAQSSVTSPGRYQYPNPVVYGRCVADSNGEYNVVIQQYCV